MEVSNRKTTSKLAGNSLNYPSRPARSPSPSKFSQAGPAGTQEPFRPKAKVNTSGLLRANKPSSVVSTSSKVTSTPSTIRGRDFPAPQAIRSTVSGSANKSSKPMLKGLQGGLKPPGTQSVPTTPVNAAKASAPPFREPSPAERRRSRTESMSLHRSVSISSLQGMKPRAGAPDPSPPSSVLSGVDTGPSPVQAFKVKAKLTGLAKNLDLLSLPQPNGHSPVQSHRDLPRGRTASISSSSALSISSSPTMHHPQSPPTFYPITTATPAANPHRYPTARVHHANLSQGGGGPQYQPFISASRSEAPQPQARIRATATVSPGHAHHLSGSTTPKLTARVSGSRRNSIDIDPAAIPLPVHSPPGSALSYSSRSSVSQSSASASYHDHDSDSTNPSTSTSGLRDRAHRNHPRDEVDGEERKHRAEAKTNRKIADLEITNRSLLAINASLEKTKSKQAKEIRDLRRKLRETRLILPPRAYRAMTSDDIHTDANEESSSDDDDGSGDEAEGVDDDTGEQNGRRHTKLDEAYRRVQLMLESLMDSGKRALETQPSDFLEEEARGGARVLSAEEQRSWRGETDGHGHDNEDLNEDQDDMTRVPRPRDGAVSPASIMMPHSDEDDEDADEDGEATSEDEVEALALHHRSFTVSPSSTPGPPPPIRIFASP